jgi:hypothetical protein
MRQENNVSTQEQIDTAISTMEEAMKALRELGLITEGDEDE